MKRILLLCIIIFGYSAQISVSENNTSDDNAASDLLSSVEISQKSDSLNEYTAGIIFHNKFKKNNPPTIFINYQSKVNIYYSVTNDSSDTLLGYYMQEKSYALLTGDDPEALDNPNRTDGWYCTTGTVNSMANNITNNNYQGKNYDISIKKGYIKIELPNISREANKIDFAPEADPVTYYKFIPVYGKKIFSPNIIDTLISLSYKYLTECPNDDNYNLLYSPDFNTAFNFDQTFYINTQELDEKNEDGFKDYYYLGKNPDTEKYVYGQWATQKMNTKQHCYLWGDKFDLCL